MKTVSCEICRLKTRRIENEKRNFMAKFPLDEARCRQWVVATGNEDLIYVPIEKLHQLKYICGKHFRSKDYNKKKTQLRKTAVPCIDTATNPLKDEMMKDFPLHIAQNETTQFSIIDHLYCTQEPSTPPLETVSTNNLLKRKRLNSPCHRAPSEPARSANPAIIQPTEKTEIQLTVSEAPNEEEEKMRTDENDTVHKTLAELPVCPEDPLPVDQEYAMDVDEDDDDCDCPWWAPDDDEARAESPRVVEQPVELETEESTLREEVIDTAEMLQTDNICGDEPLQDSGIAGDFQCRCCLKIGLHTPVKIEQELECFNILISTDPRVSQRVCTKCFDFLQEAKEFRDMVAASQRTLFRVHGVDIDVTHPAPSSQTYVKASHEEEFQRELMEIREKSEVCVKSEAVPLQEMADVGDIKFKMPDEGTRSATFSQLSDYPDVQIDTKENYEDLTNKEIDDMVRLMKKKQSELAIFIRENLIMILDYTTVLPFESVKGDMFQCIYCDAGYTQIDQLRDHVEATHRNEETSFKHDIIQLIHKAHSQTLLFADTGGFKCRLCDTQFTTIDNLVQHLITVHEKKYHNVSNDPPHNIIFFDLSLDSWKCLYCGKTCPDFSKLRLHVIKHYGNYLCHQCGSKFLYSKHYCQHIRTHRRTNKNKQTCEVCGESFMSKKLLLYHQYKNHYKMSVKSPKGEIVQHLAPPIKEETPGVAYECILCQNGISFTDIHTAYMHRIGHLNNTRQGPFICEICKHVSSVKSNFRLHLQAHYGIKTNVCEICKLVFRKSSQLSDHMNVHFNLKFQCPLCNTTLSTKKHLKHHVNSLHPDVTVEFSL